MSSIEVPYTSVIQPSDTLQTELYPLIHSQSGGEETIEFEEHLETTKYIEPEGRTDSGGEKMSEPTTPTWQDAINSLLNAAAAIIYNIGSVVANNASLIATVLVLGAVAVAAITVARRVLPGISSFFRGLF